MALELDSWESERVKLSMHSCRLLLGILNHNRNETRRRSNQTRQLMTLLKSFCEFHKLTDSKNTVGTEGNKSVLTFL